MRKTKLVYINLIICIAISLVVQTGCVNTEGTLKIKGKVLDESTKKGIPARTIIVQGLIDSDNKLLPIEVGQFSSDSSGYFTYSFRKIKGAFYYNFCLVGDSEYPFTTSKIALIDLKRNAKYVFLYLSKLADLTIIINRKSKTPVCDSLSLSWESNRVYGRFIYPYKIVNYGKTNNSFGFTSDTELRWIGGNVNSTINTKVFADKRTKLLWELYRQGKKMVFIDTITCKRDFANTVYFTY